ncbi:hypothetical protein G9A89_002605 [Geosiphon pyriformis]|nr:hypothetical protein G9A89_002605 [Geosiphon pyriformis]
MENKEINKYRPEVHDCNECEKCQESIKNNNNNYCSACQFIFFEKLYKDFSSGNQIVDETIKNPMYIPPNEDEHRIYNGELNYYEWIPWERLSNINEIAKGGFGIIYKATLIDGLIDVRSIKHHGSMEHERKGGKKVAIKIIKMDSEEVFKELNIQRAMFIKNRSLSALVSKMYGITQNAATLEYGIVMEFAEHGDMRKYLSKNFHSMSWEYKLFIARFIASGLDSIHSSGMVHRDLHSGNILQYKSFYFNARICDLGLCQPTNTNHEATTTEEKKIYGVIPYIPPEVLRGEKFTLAGDIYSFAMLLWELATGKPPFHDRSHDHFLIMDILNGQRPKITSPLIPLCIAEIIEKCWDANPENRPSVKEVRQKLVKLEDNNFEFLESDKYVKEMVKNDSTTTTTTTKSIHPGAVYTSRVLTAKIVDFSKG